MGNNQCVWIQIQNDSTGSTPTCLWLWSTSPSLAEGGVGDAVTWQNGAPKDFDMAFCVNGDLGDPLLCQPVINTGCSGAVTPCTQPAPTPGCVDQECCTLVCEQVSVCCLSPWSQLCVDVANVICSQCGEVSTGDCFAANFTPYCNDQCDGEACIGCCQRVCDVDPFCCGAENGDWDGFCVFQAGTRNCLGSIPWTSPWAS